MDIPTIAVISDLHIADSMHDVTVDDGHALADSILADPDVDVVVNLGDDTGSGLAEEWVQVMPVTMRLRYGDPDYLIVPSNHDVTLGGVGRRQVTRTVWDVYAAGMMDGYTPWSDWPQVRDYGDLRIILVDTCGERASLARGRIGEEQLERIGQATEEWDGVVALFGHHCVTVKGSKLDRTRVLTDREELREAVESAGGADLFAGGHNHRRAAWGKTWWGFRLMIALPMCAREGVWAKLEWDEERGRFGWEWVEV